MSNIDKRALREAAEKALQAMQRLLMMPNDELFDEALLNVDGDVDAANAFNLLTGPETVLALLDELEAKDKQIAELTEARDLFNSKMMGFAYRVEELEARTVKLPEVRITIAESKLRNLTYQQLDAFNAGASRAVAKLSQVLADAGVAVEGE